MLRFSWYQYMLSSFTTALLTMEDEVCSCYSSFTGSKNNSVTLSMGEKCLQFILMILKAIKLIYRMTEKYGHTQTLFSEKYMLP